MVWNEKGELAGGGGGGGVAAGDSPTWTGVHTFTNSAPIVVTQGAATSGSPSAVTITGGAHTTLAASTEATDVSLALARTVQWSTGALTTQRFVNITAPTMAFVGASTVTNAATLAISGAPVAGTNATITNAYALWVQGGKTAIGGNVDLTGANPFIAATGANSRIDLQGNLVASDTGPDIRVRTTATRTAGSLFRVANNTTTRFDVFYHGGITIAQGVASSGVAQLLAFTGAAHTGQTAGTEAIDCDFNLARVVTHGTGAITTQRSVLIQAATHAFGAASTITDAATLAITGAPIAGTNATITRGYALWIQGGGMRVDGNVGFFNAVPVAQQVSAANLTNNVTSGGTDDTIANYTDLATYATDAAAIRNNIYQLARKLKQVNDALRLYGLLS